MKYPKNTFVGGLILSVAVYFTIAFVFKTMPIVPGTILWAILTIASAAMIYLVLAQRLRRAVLIFLCFTISFVIYQFIPWDYNWRMKALFDNTAKITAAVGRAVRLFRRPVNAHPEVAGVFHNIFI